MIDPTQPETALATLFRPADELLVDYARYHRDRRNIATHCVGIPLIVFGLDVLLSRPVLGSVQAGGEAWHLLPAGLLWGLSTLWYLSRGLPAIGLLVSLLHAAMVLLAAPLGQGSTGSWLTWSLGCLALGAVCQAVGHYYEGRAPAFVEDLVALLAGPLFVVVELLFTLGWLAGLRQQLEREAGPTQVRDLAGPVTSMPGAGRRHPRPHRAAR
ncbi:DUF962 domain-containing protein [Ideonella sp. B7]|nr:DUF962 domain-containing protein [Ideonella benzenivorans]